MNPNDNPDRDDLPAPPAEETLRVIASPLSGLPPAPAWPVDSETNAPETPGDVPAVDAPAGAPAPGMEPAAGLPGKAPLRPLPETLTAARDAAAFVAQLFAEVSATEGPTPPVAVPEAAGGLPLADATTPDRVDGEGEGDSEGTRTEESAASGSATTSPLQGVHVLVLGLGASGLAMVRWCVRQGARVTVADTRETPPQWAQLQAELPQVVFRCGAFEAALIEGQDIRAVFRSPGLSPAMVAPVWDAARTIGLWVGGELDLFARALRQLQADQAYSPKVLAITGTNGKTTTTALTGQLLSHAGKTVAVAGNIGPSLLDTLAGHIDAASLPEVWVLELSSFQLDGVQGFEPTAATVLNLSQDHLDWHGNMQAYAAAKARVFGDSALLVLNRDDPAVMAMLPEPVRARLQKPKWRPHVIFGLGMPQRPGDFGIETVNGMDWLVRAAEADETIKRRRDEEVELHVQRLMPVDALRIRGRHNATNALAALALAGSVGVGLAPMLHGLREYTGEPHRVASVAVIRDVEYFDDSKGTNVGATVAALVGLGSGRQLVLIAGGDGKGQDFSPLADPVRRHARAVVLIGRDAPAIAAVLEGTGVPLHHVDSMEAAVQAAASLAQTGDAVLMSPACASWDMFENYGQRAQVFCDAVRALALDAGELA